MKKLTHFDKQGRAKMVDISDKPMTVREAIAKGSVYMKPETLRLITDKKIPKGDVFCVSMVAGTMAAKYVGSLIPMCHALNVASVNIDFDIDKRKNKVDIRAQAKITGQTGVEMEALTAVSVAALTVYDMCKSVDKEMIISDIMLVEKRGGKSGTFKRK
jgi:cyclic pyranopterin monophosphate synthase